MTLVLYAVISERPRRDLGGGLGARKLAAVRIATLWVVVERGSLPEVSAKTLRAYDRILRRIGRACPAVLPFRFGTVVADRRALEKEVGRLTSVLEPALEHVRGAVQYTLRVYGAPARPISAPRGAGPGTRWLTKRARSMTVPEIAPITKAVSPFVRDSRVERRAPARESPWFATVHHLVARSKVAEFRTAVARSQAKVKNVVVRVSGPWPPYAFAEIGGVP